MTNPSEINIKELIEQNPITSLHGNYHSRLINKIKNEFTNDEQRLFVASFYCSLNYDQANDFIIDLDDVWKFLDYNRKAAGKRTLENNFELDTHYKIVSLPNVGKQTKGRGGQNKEKILLTINTFKAFCMISCTEKAKRIHNYYIKMEQIVHDIANEETNELRNQVMIRDEDIKNRQEEYEENLLTNSSDKPLVYLGLVDNDVVKFGYSRGIEKRVRAQHKRDFPNFELKYVIHGQYCNELEGCIKQACKQDNSVLYNRQITKEYNGKNQTELIQLDTSFTVKDLYEEVCMINDSLIKKKRIGENALIISMRNEIKAKTKQLVHLQKLCKEHNIDYGDEKTTPSISTKEFDILKYKYILQFLEHFMNNDEESKSYIWVSHADFYKEYETFILNKYEPMYIVTEHYFNGRVGKCPAIVIQRQTISRNHPDYVKGKDNRIHGKRVYFKNTSFESWIREQYLLLN